MLVDLAFPIKLLALSGGVEVRWRSVLLINSVFHFIATFGKDIKSAFIFDHNNTFSVIFDPRNFEFRETILERTCYINSHYRIDYYCAAQK